MLYPVLLLIHPCQKLIICHESNLTIKAVNLGDLSALMVSTEKCDTVGPLGFQHQQIGERLQTVISSINKVTLQMTRLINYTLPKQTVSQVQTKVNVQTMNM